MSQPLVTIVTPSYQQGHFLRATIESVLAQDYPNIEYLIMDGGSTDESASIAAEYGSRLSWTSETDRGQSHAINKGFQRARGSIVAWINSDDTLLPGAVTAAVTGLEQHPDSAAIYGDGYQIDRDGNIKQQFPFTEAFNLWKLVHLCDYILQQTVFFRRASLEEVGWLREDLNYAMDWDILVRLGKRFGLSYIPERLGCLREYGEAKTFAGGAHRFDELAALLRQQSGRRFPPGYWFYGLDTYDKIGAEKIRRWIPGAPGERLAEKFIALMRTGIHRAQEKQGIGPHGWAAKNIHWMTPENHRWFRVDGELPEDRPALAGQVLHVYCNGKPVDAQRLPFGNFSFQVNLKGRGPHTLRIASRLSSGGVRWRARGLSSGL